MREGSKRRVYNKLWGFCDQLNLGGVVGVKYSLLWGCVDNRAVTKRKVAVVLCSGIQEQQVCGVG